MFATLLVALSMSLMALNCMPQISTGTTQTRPDFYGAASMVSLASARESNPVRFVSLCDIVANAKRYSGKTIRTDAIMVIGSEQSFLYDADCNGLESFVWVEYESDYKSPTHVKRTYDRLMSRTFYPHNASRARVMVVGKLEGPSGGRYGHVDQFRFQLRVLQLEKAQAVAKTTRWPVAIASPGSSFESDEEVRRLNEGFVYHLSGAPKYKKIPQEILADDFTFTDAEGKRTNKLTFLELSVDPFSGLIRNSEVRVDMTDSKATATGVVEKLREGTVVERKRYQNRFVRHSGQWQLLSSQLTVSLNNTVGRK
jgi:hypothetical protein